MALYTPDYKYQRGRELLEKLDGLEGEEIRYYVNQEKKYHQKIEKKYEELLNAIRTIKNHVP